MIHIIVRIEPKPDKVEAFLELATYDARNSRLEPGCLRFDVLRHNDAPPRFAFYEVYKDEEAVKAHQKTEHYARWRREMVEKIRSRLLLLAVPYQAGHIKLWIPHRAA